MTKLIMYGVLLLVFFPSSRNNSIVQSEMLPAAEIRNSDNTEAGIYLNRPVAGGKINVCRGVIDTFTENRIAEGGATFKPGYLNGLAGIIKIKKDPEPDAGLYNKNINPQNNKIYSGITATVLVNEKGMTFMDRSYSILYGSGQRFFTIYITTINSTEECDLMLYNCLING